MGELEKYVGLMVALSMATERLAEALRNTFLPGLGETRLDPVQEAKRKRGIQWLAIVSGIVTAAIARSFLPNNEWQTVLLFGIAASGGSGFWNAIMGYVLELLVSTVLYLL